MIDNKPHIDMEEFTSFEDLPIEEQLKTYISDQHKSVYGYRPNPSNYSQMSETELREESDFLSEKLEEVMEEEEKREQESVKRFKKLLQDTIELGAGDEETALRWLTSEVEPYSSMDTEGYIWSQGILFTEYGREIVKKLNQIYFE